MHTINLYLKFHPHDLAISDFNLPIVVNELLGLEVIDPRQFVNLEGIDQDSVKIVPFESMWEFPLVRVVCSVNCGKIRLNEDCLYFNDGKKQVDMKSNFIQSLLIDDFCTFRKL